MIEPYNDEEIEELKKWRENNGVHSLGDQSDRLIATIDKLKEANVKLFDESKRDYTALLEENDELKEDRGGLIEEIGILIGELKGARNDQI